ncbi:MAG: hypothetical protein OES09_13395 [Gammaproteobacteria bacterium]|nr:hypothetical protein [Gammaproteobacteria bacterium]
MKIPENKLKDCVGALHGGACPEPLQSRLEVLAERTKRGFKGPWAQTA